MIYKPSPERMRNRSHEIITARKWAVGLISTLLGVGMFISEIQRLRTLPTDIMNYVYLALFVVTGVLIFLWIWATQKELDLLFEYLDPQRYTPPSTAKETFLILLGLRYCSSASFLPHIAPYCLI